METGSGALERLRCYDAPTVGDPIELPERQVAGGGLHGGRIRPYFPDSSPMVRFTATATFWASERARGFDGSSTGEQARRFGNPSELPVVFQTSDDSYVVATFEKVMCVIYQAFGADGLITSETKRDLERVRALNFLQPVARGPQ